MFLVGSVLLTFGELLSYSTQKGKTTARWRALSFSHWLISPLSWFKCLQPLGVQSHLLSFFVGLFLEVIFTCSGDRTFSTMGSVCFPPLKAKREFTKPHCIFTYWPPWLPVGQVLLLSPQKRNRCSERPRDLDCWDHKCWSSGLNSCLWL